MMNLLPTYPSQILCRSQTYKDKEKAKENPNKEEKLLLPALSLQYYLLTKISHHLAKEKGVESSSRATNKAMKDGLGDKKQNLY